MRSKKRNILFITWDGQQTNYLESLFLPIFKGIENWNFHVVQFSWARKEKQERLNEVANRMGISYTHFNIFRNPHPLPGTVITLVRGISFLKMYIKKHCIDVIMPRSTFPAMIAMEIKKKLPELPIIFDADGLPLEERIDFSGLNPHGLQYKFFKKREIKMLQLADAVLVRSNKATCIHLTSIGKEHAKKFFKVSNGRDETVFRLDPRQRELGRKKLGLCSGQLLLVYCGSLGPQYGLDTMLMIFNSLLLSKPDSRFLILTPQGDYLKKSIPLSLQHGINIITGPYSDVPFWLNSADLAFAIREPKFSMQGVFPIKIGEYLLMGLPTICSQGIGDTEEILLGHKFVHLFNHQEKEEVNKVIDWVNQIDICDKKDIRSFALQYYTVTKSIADYKNALDVLFPTA